MDTDPGGTADPAVTELSARFFWISCATLLSAGVVLPNLFCLCESECTIADAFEYSAIRALNSSLQIWSRLTAHIGPSRHAPMVVSPT